MYRTLLAASAFALATVAAPAFAQAVVSTSVSASISGPYTERILSAAEATADVNLMRRALETIHPGLYRRTSKAAMDRAFAALEAAAAKPIPELELYRRISLLLADIRCNHTKAEQPRAFEQWRKTNPSHLPFRFRILEGRMIVVSGDPGQSELARGTEVLAINGRPIKELIATLGAYVPIDGDTVWARATNLASDGDLMGSDFDHFYPYVYGIPTVFTVEVRDSDTAMARTVTLKPISFDSWLTLPTDRGAYRGNFSEMTNWKMLDADTGFLRIGTFVNYRKPVDAAAIYNGVFAGMKAAGARNLILDLRNNGGGSSDATYALMDFLAQKPFVWNKAIRQKVIRYGDLPDFISSWGDRNALFFPPEDGFTRAPNGWFDANPSQEPDELLPRTPSTNGFAGPVTILTSPVNASGSTMLIAKLADMGRVRLVGERSGGSGDGPTAGMILNVKLPNSGIQIRVPNAFNAMQVSRFEARGGIVPDVLVKDTVADFRAGRDRVLEVARADADKPMPKVEPTSPPAALAGLRGQWVGTLEYRDFQSDRRVTLPTKLSAEPLANGIAMAFTYDDGPGKIVRDGYRLSVDGAEGILAKTDDDGPSLYRIIGDVIPKAGAPIRWTLWGRGTENDKPVDVRETLTLTDDEFTLLRETRAKGGAGPYLFRHAYRFVRVRE